MNGCVIPHTPIAVDCWQRRLVHAKICFLTHMHADHTQGLTSSWDQPIYCSEITRSLAIEQLNIKPCFLISIPVGQSTIIPLDDAGVETMTVTLIDANHCAGAVMVLFQGYFGCILHTGDFRYFKGMLDVPPFTNDIVINTLYLDNTYCDPRCEFPSRDEAIKEILKIIHDNPGKEIRIGLDKLGKEDLLLEVAKDQCVPIFVEEKLRLKVAELLGHIGFFTRNQEDTYIKVFNRRSVNRRALADLNRNVRPSIGILPSALYNGRTNPFAECEDIFVVPYSDHSSFSELKEFVARLRPERIIPVVSKFSRKDEDSPHDRSDMTIFANEMSSSAGPHVFDLPSTVREFMSRSFNNGRNAASVKRRASTSYFNSRSKRACGIVFSPEKQAAVCVDTNEVTVQKESNNSNQPNADTGVECLGNRTTVDKNLPEDEASKALQEERAPFDEKVETKLVGDNNNEVLKTPEETSQKGPKSVGKSAPETTLISTELKQGKLSEGLKLVNPGETRCKRALALKERVIKTGGNRVVESPAAVSVEPKENREKLSPVQLPNETSFNKRNPDQINILSQRGNKLQQKRDDAFSILSEIDANKKTELQVNLNQLTEMQLELSSIKHTEALNDSRSTSHDSQTISNDLETRDSLASIEHISQLGHSEGMVENLDPWICTKTSNQCNPLEPDVPISSVQKVGKPQTNKTGNKLRKSKPQLLLPGIQKNVWNPAKENGARTERAEIRKVAGDQQFPDESCPKVPHVAHCKPDDPNRDTVDHQIQSQPRPQDSPKVLNDVKMGVAGTNRGHDHPLNKFCSTEKLNKATTSNGEYPKIAKEVDGLNTEQEKQHNLDKVFSSDGCGYLLSGRNESDPIALNESASTITLNEQVPSNQGANESTSSSDSEFLKLQHVMKSIIIDGKPGGKEKGRYALNNVSSTKEPNNCPVAPNLDSAEVLCECETTDTSNKKVSTENNLPETLKMLEELKTLIAEEEEGKLKKSNDAVTKLLDESEPIVTFNKDVSEDRESPESLTSPEPTAISKKEASREQKTNESSTSHDLKRLTADEGGKLETLSKINPGGICAGKDKNPIISNKEGLAITINEQVVSAQVVQESTAPSEGFRNLQLEMKRAICEDSRVVKKGEGECVLSRVSCTNEPRDCLLAHNGDNAMLSDETAVTFRAENVNESSTSIEGKFRMLDDLERSTEVEGQCKLNMASGTICKPQTCARNTDSPEVIGNAEPTIMPQEGSVTSSLIGEQPMDHAERPTVVAGGGAEQNKLNLVPSFSARGKGNAINEEELTVQVSEANIQLIFGVLDSQEQAKTSIRVLEADDINLVPLDRFYSENNSGTCDSNDIDVYLRILNKTGTPICIEVDDVDQLVRNDANTILEMSELRHNESVDKDDSHDTAHGNSITAHEICRCDMRNQFDDNEDPTMPLITSVCGDNGEILVSKDGGDGLKRPHRVLKCDQDKDSSTESLSQMSTFQHQETLNQENRKKASNELWEAQNINNSRNLGSNSKQAYPKRVRLMEKPVPGNADELQIFCYREPALHSLDNCEEGYPKHLSEKPVKQSDDDVQITYYTSSTPEAPASQISQASSGSGLGLCSTSRALSETGVESEKRQPNRNPASKSRRKNRKPKGIYRELLIPVLR